MFPFDKVKQKAALKKVRDSDPSKWSILNSVLTVFYNLFRKEHFKQQEQSMGVEGSYEAFEHMFDEGHIVLTQAEEPKGGTLYTLWIWDELEYEYKVPEGPNTVLI